MWNLPETSDEQRNDQEDQPNDKPKWILHSVRKSTEININQLAGVFKTEKQISYLPFSKGFEKICQKFLVIFANT